MSGKSFARALGVTTLLLCFAGALSGTFARSSIRSNSGVPAVIATSTGDENRCRHCHSAEADGFARSKMAHSMRRGGQEPTGSVHVPGTSILMSSDKNGSWQSLESHGSKSTYHVDYVIGSGTHASGYLIDLGDHLFQSPVAYYQSRAEYDLAPGYEGKPDPDFTRPIAEGCVFCHAGSFQAVTGTQNEFSKTPFPHLAIGCDRCHGATAAHLANPNATNIVNPERLEADARDSVCEQCHLIGVARVLNPGKRFSDFKPGKPLEETFTIYRNRAPNGSNGTLKVISHAEQLALSKCKRDSGGQMWCGTCHDPHDEPVQAAAYYRQKCWLCHAKTKFAADHPARTSDCIGCHMPERETNDGGHTAFTDHRIQIRPKQEAAEEAATIAPWREAPGEFATRNLGIASIQVGMTHKSWPQIVSGYRMLTSVQQQFSQDSEMYEAMGNALFAGHKYDEAAEAFELAAHFDPTSSPKQANLGQTYLASGKRDLAERYLETAIELDPLNLSAAALLIKVYRESGETSKADELSKKLTKIVENKGDGE
jgi:hypothetical protein